MEFLLFDNNLKEKYSGDILALMYQSDNDFVPPLSKRTSTTQTNLKGNDADSSFDGIASYHQEMMKQYILGVVEDERLLGFVSYKEDMCSDVIGEDTLPNIYVSTLMLHTDARGKNLTYRMYDYLFNEVYKNSSIFTRTWSTNFAHIKILSKFSFDELKRIENDRGAGIDTVYYSLIR